MRFGPYPNVGMAHAAVAMVRDLYPIRTCDLDLSPHKIAQGKYKVCLEYHMKKCKAPCVGYQTAEDYAHNIREITSLLRGNLRDVIDLYREEMLRLSEELRFEEAQIYKERLQYLENSSGQAHRRPAPHPQRRRLQLRRGRRRRDLRELHAPHPRDGHAGLYHRVP